MKDISIIFDKASQMTNNYNARLLSREIEKEANIWCRLEDDTNFNWYLISQNNGKSIIKDFGYLSAKYPVALLKKKCPNYIYKLLSKNGILIDDYCERYSCIESVLRRYVGDIDFIDDRFLFDESIPFDEELFLKIDEGINYINPYNFNLNDIK